MANAGYQWMTMTDFPNGGLSAVGSIVGGEDFNDVSVAISHTGGNMSAHEGAVGWQTFPETIEGVLVNIPQTETQIKNIADGVFRAVFNKPVTNVLVAFGSVGQPGYSVPVIVSRPFTPMWDTATTYYEPIGATQYTQFTGAEGYNIIRIDGTMSEVLFTYTVAENYCTVSFGFVDQNDPELDRGCNPLFDKFAYLQEDGCQRFKRLRHLGYL